MSIPQVILVLFYNENGFSNRINKGQHKKLM